MSEYRTDARGVIAPCDSCGAKNRVPFGKLDQAARCASCGQALPAPGGTIEVRRAEHLGALLGAAPVPVLVDFWAPWCGPCLAVAPALEEVAGRGRGEYVVAKVDTQALPGAGAQHGVRAIPTMAVFLEGEEVARAQGARPAADIERLVRGALG